MKRDPKTVETERGFSLLELLVAITIVAILASVLLPALHKVRERALIVSAKNDAAWIANALYTYRTEYGRLPLKGENAGRDPADPIKTEADFMKILLAEEMGPANAQRCNPRGIRLFKGKIQSRKGGHGLDLAGNYLDPWGNPYEIYLDGDNDGKIDFLGVEERGDVRVRSWGPDGKPEVPADKGKTDDVKSWK